MDFKQNNFKESNQSADLIYGAKPVIEALGAGKEIDKLFIQRDIKNDQVILIQRLAAERNISIAKVPIWKLNKFTRKNHQGIVGLLSAVTYSSLEQIIPNLYEKGITPLILILDRVTDVRNFGAIARSAECLGVHAIVVPSKGAAQIGSDALKTSAGALNHIPVCREKNLKDTVTFLQNSGLQVIACTEKGEDTVYMIDYKGPTAIVMGSEEDGVSAPLLRIVDSIAQIPMAGKINSLNVSVATGIILSEVNRQKLANAHG